MTHDAVTNTLTRPGGPHTCYGDAIDPADHTCHCPIGSHHTAAQHRADMRNRAAGDTTPTADLERILR